VLQTSKPSGCSHSSWTGIAAKANQRLGAILSFAEWTMKPCLMRRTLYLALSGWREGHQATDRLSTVIRFLIKRPRFERTTRKKFTIEIVGLGKLWTSIP